MEHTHLIFYPSSSSMNLSNHFVKSRYDSAVWLTTQKYEIFISIYKEEVGWRELFLQFIDNNILLGSGCRRCLRMISDNWKMCHLPRKEFSHHHSHEHIPEIHYNLHIIKEQSMLENETFKSNLDIIHSSTCDSHGQIDTWQVCLQGCSQESPLRDASAAHRSCCPLSGCPSGSPS